MKHPMLTIGLAIALINFIALFYFVPLGWVIALFVGSTIYGAVLASLGIEPTRFYLNFAAAFELILFLIYAPLVVSALFIVQIAISIVLPTPKLGVSS